MEGAKQRRTSAGRLGRRRDLRGAQDSAHPRCTIRGTPMPAPATSEVPRIPHTPGPRSTAPGPAARDFRGAKDPAPGPAPATREAPRIPHISGARSAAPPGRRPKLPRCQGSRTPPVRDPRHPRAAPATREVPRIPHTHGARPAAPPGRRPKLPRCQGSRTPPVRDPRHPGPAWPMHPPAPSPASARAEPRPPRGRGSGVLRWSPTGHPQGNLGLDSRWCPQCPRSL